MVPDAPDNLKQLVFRPLLSSTSIRILELLPGTSAEHIRCRLLYADLVAVDIPFQAISYTWAGWNDVTSRRAVECDGGRAVIPASLHSVLSRLRDDKHSHRLWADALCINQSLDASALEERAAQVKMMDQIFPGAELVYVDLGDADEEESALIEMLHPLHDFAEHFIEDSPSRSFQRLRALVVLPDLRHPGWEHFVKLVARPYFRRLWVLQEYVLAKCVILLLGRHQMPSSFMDTLLFANRALSIQLTEHCSGRKVQANVANLSDLVGAMALLTAVGSMQMQFVRKRRDRLDQHSDHHTFANLLRHGMDFNVTDPRDRIYAVLGLATDVDSASFPVSYLESVHKVARRAASWLIENGNGSFALSHCIGIGAASDPGASWAFSWLTRENDYLMGSINEFGECTNYSAGGNTKLALQATDNELELWAQATLLGEITFMTESNTIRFAAWDQQNVEAVGLELMNWALHISRWIDQLRVDLLDPPEEVEVWRAATCDLHIWRTDFVATRTSESPTYKEALASFIEDMRILRDLDEHKSAWENDAYPPFEELVARVVPMMMNLGFGVGRRLAITTTGTLCLVPTDAEAGDRLTVFCGMPIPFLLRPTGNKFAILGLCYVHDMMDGQAFEGSKHPIQNILLS